MTAYTRSKLGPPTAGRYVFGDIVTDANGIRWFCARSGVASVVNQFVTMPPAVNLAGTTVIADPTIDSGVSATLAMESKYSGPVRRTKLTLTDVAQAVVNGTEYQGTKLITFPEGGVAILGAVMTIAQKTTSAILTTLNSGTGALSLGSATASSTTLNSTMANVIASTAFTSGATINVAGTAVTGAMTAGAFLNGTGTAIALFINTGYATTTDVDADATQTLTGTIEVTWIPMGDV